MLAQMQAGRQGPMGRPPAPPLKPAAPPHAGPGPGPRGRGPTFGELHGAVGADVLDAWVGGAGSAGEAATRAFSARLMRHLESWPAGDPPQKVAGQGARGSCVLT
jgi:hypothetical protein